MTLINPYYIAVAVFLTVNEFIVLIVFFSLYPRRARSAIGVDIVLTLDVCMFVCLYVCMLAQYKDTVRARTKRPKVPSLIAISVLHYRYYSVSVSIHPAMVGYARRGPRPSPNPQGGGPREHTHLSKPISADSV